MVSEELLTEPSETELLRQQLLRAQRLCSVGTLASSVAHEFNNILTTIINYAKMGLRHRDGATRDKAFDKILAAGQRASKITTGMLSYARAKGDRREPMRLAQLVQDVLVLVEKDLQMHRVRLQTDYLGDPWAAVNAGQVQQVLLNLIINARQAMEGGGSLTITVRTNYPGVGPEEMETIVTRPIERTLASAPGVDRITSTSVEGSSQVRVMFNWGTNLDEAANEIRTRIDRIRGQLPPEVEPPTLFKFDVSQFPIMFLGLSGDMDPRSLRQFAEDEIQYRLERIPGVRAVTYSRVPLLAGQERPGGHRRQPAAAASITSGRSSSNAAWSARSAVSRSSSAMIVVIRISEVEIISMFTPALARAAKNFAVTPGCDRMPAPISDTLPMRSS